MSSIADLWEKSKETFETKNLQQILSFAGDGKLRDGNLTSKEFRELLEKLPSKILKTFAENCLAEKFDDSGLALQDVLNQIGSRLNFTVENGLYRGRQNEIGYDGIWTSQEGHNIIVEFKTTDAYRINLDIIADYRNKLIKQNRVDASKSSILIIDGRQDTGDLVAQIRGSKHAWDIKLISTDSLLKLLTLKETLNDTKTIQQINELLKPNEYTRIDKLIDLIFITSQDLQPEEPPKEALEIEIEDKAENTEEQTKESKSIPVNFHEECVAKIQSKLNIPLIKQTRASYNNKENTLGLTCAVSKSYERGKNIRFWFAFHPYQQDYLKEFPEAYVAFGCGSAENTFLIPFREFQPLIQYLLTTENGERMYWHIIIYQRETKFVLRQPKNEKEKVLDITKYRI
jgi:hypothetical protein